jgi:hypothetical protein
VPNVFGSSSVSATPSTEIDRDSSAKVGAQKRTEKTNAATSIEKMRENNFMCLFDLQF